MEFEYDPDKSESNRRKHGVDFEEAQALWLDPHAVTAKVWEEPEERWALFAVMGGKHWTAIYTVREGRVRIISVRRSRGREEELYEGRKG